MKTSVPISVMPTKSNLRYYTGSRQVMYEEVMNRYEKLVFKLSPKMKAEHIEKLKDKWKHKELELI